MQGFPNLDPHTITVHHTSPVQNFPYLIQLSQSYQMYSQKRYIAPWYVQSHLTCMHEKSAINIANNIYILYNLTVKINQLKYLCYLYSEEIQWQKQSLMQLRWMSNGSLLNNFTGGDWTTFHAHMHSVVNCITFFVSLMHWSDQFTYFAKVPVKPATLVSINTSRFLCAPSPSSLHQSHSQEDSFDLVNLFIC